MTHDPNEQQGQPFGGYLLKPEPDEQGIVRWVPDLERPYFDADGTPEALATGETTEPKSRTVWYVSRRTDAMDGTAPAWGELGALERRLWFDELSTDEAACARAWAGVAKWIARTFPGCHATRKPSETALALIEHALPWGSNDAAYRYPTLSDDLRRLVAATTALHRYEHLALPGVLMHSYAYYDQRVAYAACLRRVPIVPAEGVQHDDVDAYERNRPGKYRCDVTVPVGWAHVGLARRRNPSAPAGSPLGWEWPTAPGESWESWLDESEVRLLDDRGWPYAVRERILFAPEKPARPEPLREYRERVVSELERIEGYPMTPPTRAYRFALRALIITAVGQFHKGYSKESRHIIDLDELTEDDAEATITRDASGWTVTSSVDLSPFRSRWQRPEWSSSIYARMQVSAVRRALEIPRANLLAIRDDAIHLRDFNPGITDTGKVGAYRLKASRTFSPPIATPVTPRELLALEKGARP